MESVQPDTTKQVAEKSHFASTSNHIRERYTEEVYDQNLRDTGSEESQSNKDIETEKAVDGKKLTRKLDWRLVPWFSLLYLMSFLDRGAIGNARLYNMEADLQITDKQYLLALTVFYFSYALLEAPSNLVLKRVKPRIWLSSLIFMWGIVMTLQGTVRNFGGLVTLRFFLGIFEAGLFPGIAFYLSCWYKRSQLGIRIAYFFSAATVSGAFSGLLATAISKMEGVGGKHAWSWIFILEGLATILIAIASFWVIDDFPESARFLSEVERSYLVEELRKDGQISASKEPFKMKFVRQAAFDYKVWCAMFIFVGFDGALYAFSLFTPSIINKLGYHANIANLLSVPVYVWACIVTCVVGYIGDKYANIRGYLNFVFFGIGMAGYIILIISHSPALSYFAVYLAACGIYPTTPTSIAWVSANTAGPLKRSIVIAMCIGFGNINGAITSNVYRAEQAPWYRLGHGIVLAYITIGFISSLVYWLVCRRENAQRETGVRDEVISGQKGGFEKNGVFESVDEAKLEKGDNWSGFRYVF